MMKKLTAKVGEYTNQQGETKGRYVDLGVILSNENGEYMLLDASVNLAGVLMKQNTYLATKGKAPKDSVMVSIFEKDGGSAMTHDASQNAYQQPSQGAQHAPQQGFNQANAPQQVQNQPQNQGLGQSAPNQGADDWDDSDGIPF